MEWNGNFGMEYGRCQNGMEDLKNGMEDNLPYQFHTRFRAMYLQKNLYGCRGVINNTALSLKYSTSISTRIICRQIALLWLCILRKQCTYCIIVRTLQFAALM